MTINSPKYAYTELAPRQIRMLQIHPAASHSDPIVCSLFIWSIDIPPAPFEALSYTWGDAQERYWISIDGLAFQVAPNLLGALQRFRLTGEPRYLWVDAICINQDDLTERGSQVQFMDLIYQRAARVVVWLGASYNDSNLAFELLNKLVDVVGKERRELKDNEGFRKYAVHGDIVARGLPPPSDPAWLALDALVWRPWFLRVWVVQEVCVSRSATVYCGVDNIDFDAFCDVGRYMHSTNLTGQTAVNNDRVLSLQIARNQYQTDDRVKLTMQLINSRNCLATNPVDKVFALLNISKEIPGDGSLRPDYHKTVTEVFSDVARLLLAENLDVLNFKCDPIWQSERNLPSWAPDWSCVPREFSLLFTQRGPWFHAGKSAESSPAPAIRFSPDGRTFFIRGRILDKVTNVGETYFTFSSARLGKVHNDWFSKYIDQDKHLQSFSRGRRWMMWERLALKLKTYPATGEDILTAFQKTITADAKIQTKEEEGSSTTPPTVDDFYKAFRDYQAIFRDESTKAERMGETALRIEKDRHDIFFKEVHSVSYARKIFTTHKGYMGVGPASTSSGNYVAILEGARTAFVLNKKRSGRYVLLGEAYLHGFMNGEGMKDENPLEELAIE
ncbi:hypothetical protein SBRCBS47491_008804 [Sporothrix bragantina]|uniref:Heterokaryon incompatibility domain-containing protein n=1 Tax=Sporothrix bragantina TaxID=671064 RepID=A0ABP0CPU3_9PEZI